MAEIGPLCQEDKPKGSGRQSHKNKFKDSDTKKTNAEIFKKYFGNVDEPDKRKLYTRGEGPKIDYAKPLKIATLNIRSMCESSKREQLVEYMKKMT